MNLSSASIIEFSEFQKEALSLRSREVKKLLEKLDAEQLAKFSMEAKEKLAELKRSDANFKDTKFNDSKEISDQRYLIEVLNTRQFDLLAKEFYAADKAVDSTTKLTGEELIAATANRDAINQRLAEMGQLRNADRLESGFTNQTSQTSVMTQVLDQIKSGARDEASQDIVSDVDLQSILKDETKQLEILIANPASNQDEVASRQDTIDQLRHFVDKRAAFNDLNLPVILPVLGSSFEPHPDDKKIDLLKSNLASAAMEGRDTPDYKKAATELHEARRSYEGNDPAIRLQCSLIKVRYL